MSVTSNVGLKYLRLSSASRAVLAMTIISIIGIAIGVATLMVTLSVATGFGDAYRKSILDFNAHVVLMSMDEIKDYKSALQKLEKYNLVGVNPFIYREGLLIHKGQIRGVVMKGVDPEGLKTVSNMKLSSPIESNGALHLGSYLASEIGAVAGDKVKVMLPESWSEKGAGHFEEFTVAGTFETGMYDFDSQFVLLDLTDAQKIFGVPHTASGIEIKLNNWKDSSNFVLELERNFDYPFYATDWEELNKSLFEAVKLEKIMFIIIMGALVVVAAFNIIGTVMLRILYKTSDIAILRALGMNTKSVKRIFTFQGTAVGLFGTAIGIIVALILIWSLGRFNWVQIPPEIYLLKTLPVCISWSACVMIAAFSLIVCWLTSSIASAKVLELPLVKGLHRP